MRAFRARGRTIATLRARPTKCARLMRRTAGIDIVRPLPPEVCCVRTPLNGVRCRSVSWGTMPDPCEARLAEVVAVLSMATDLGTGQPMERGIRTCLAGVKLAELLGVDAQVISDIYYILALSALGCTADSRAAADMLGDEVDIGPAFAPIVHAPVSEALPVVARAVASGRPLGQRPWAVARFMANNLRHRPALVQAHCEVAQQLAQRLLLGRGVVESLGCIFERWDGAGMPRRLRGDAIPLPARIAHL